jgi:hypothetical protein
MLFFLDASSAYSLASIHTQIHAHSTRAHYSHHPCTNRPTTTLRSEDYVFLEITEIHWFPTDFSSDGHVTIPLWHHAWGADAWNWSKRRLFLFQGKNPGAASGSILGIELGRVRSTTGGVHHCATRASATYMLIGTSHASSLLLLYFYWTCISCPRCGSADGFCGW